MRLTFLMLVLALLTVSCSKKEAAPETGQSDPTEPVAKTEDAAESPTVDTTLESKQPQPGGPPIIELVDAGEPPLAPIRRSFEAGAKEVLTFREQHGVKMKGGGLDNQFSPAGLLQTIDFEITAVSPEGVADVALEVREVEKIEEVISGDGRDVQSMDPTGVNTTYTVDARGVISGFLLTPPTGSRLIPANLDMMAAQLRWMSPPFPEEAIGVGAKWTVNQVVGAQLTRMSEQLEVELVERTDSKIVLAIKAKSTGSRRHDFTAQSQTIDLTIDATGKTELDPTKLVPRSSNQEVRLTQAVTLLGVEPPPEGFLVMTIDWLVEAKSPRSK